MLFGAQARARLAAIPVLLLAFPWPRCSLFGPQDAGPPPPPPPSPSAPKSEAARDRVPQASPPEPPIHTIRLPDEVVVTALTAGQPAFLRCWARAQREDPTLFSAKITVHLELDASGKVTHVTNDAEAVTFGNCLMIVAQRLPFPAPGVPASADIPLIFKSE